MRSGLFAGSRAAPTSTHFRAGALACALLASTALATPALGQTAPSAPPPLHNNVDANGVDLVTGKFRYGITEAVIGSGEGAISLERYWGDDGFRTNWSTSNGDAAFAIDSDPTRSTAFGYLSKV